MHPSVDGQIGSFYVLATVNNAVISRYCCKILISFPLGISPGVELLDFVVFLFLIV